MPADCKPYYYTGKNAKVKEVFAFFPVFAGERHLIRLTDRGCRGSPAAFHPHFLFAAAKRKRRWSRQKKKRFSLRSYGRGAPCRAAGCGSKLFCSVDAAPTGARAGLLSDFRTFCAVLHSEGIGQRLNLTSCSFRAFRFAKRCPGSRGAVPLLGWPLRRFSRAPRDRAANAPLCAAGLGGCGNLPFSP